MRRRKTRKNYFKNLFERLFIKALIILLLFTPLRIGDTSSYFMAMANSTGNSITAGDWEAPVTSILALSAYTGTASFNLNYTATDSFSGVHHLELYMSKDGGPYAKYNGNYNPGDIMNFDSSTTDGDGTYRFYSIGTDNATPANVEAAPGVPDATTIVDTTSPLANAGSDQTVATGNDVTFDGSGSSDVNGIASYKWDKDASNGVNFTTPDLTGVSPTLTGGYVATGVYTVTLQVTDNAGNTATDTMTVTITPGPGSVVINELMWMGSVGNSNDEWIELRNTTGETIDLTGWTIEGAGSGPNSITLSSTIPASGYFLISHYNSSNSAINDTISVDLVAPGISLNNNGEQLTLKSASGVTIDQTPSGAWVAGIHTSPATVEQSMERNDDPTTGWHTCIDIACNDTTYWDTEGNNYGTPKAANLSDEGSGIPTPTPQPTPALEFSLRDDKKAVAFTVSDVNEFEKISYEIVYDSTDGEKGIAGSADLNGENTFSRTDLLLGTCSGIEGKVCVYDEGITKLHLKATLFSESRQTVLEKEISY